MNWQLARESSARLHDHHKRHVMSRRQFARTAAGTAITGAVVGAGIWKPKTVAAAAPTDPIPIPGGTPALGGGFHTFGPTPDGSFDPIDAEPSTITDFNGFVGLAYIDGMVTRRNTRTGEVRVFPTLGSDMRFMSGVYRGMDGKLHHGAFALV
jgi:hypothetical protein